MTMRLVLGKDEGWNCNGHSGETPRQYVTIAAVHGKHSFRDWREAAINKVTYVNIFSVDSAAPEAVPEATTYWA